MRSHELKGNVPNRTAAVTPDTSSKWGPQAACTFACSATKSRPHNLFRFDNLLEHLTELRKVLYLTMTDLKGCKLSARCTGCTARSGRAMRSGASDLAELGCVTLLVPPCIHLPGSSLSPIVQRFYLSSLTKARLIKSLAIGLSSIAIPLSFLRHWAEWGGC